MEAHQVLITDNSSKQTSLLQIRVPSSTIKGNIAQLPRLRLTTAASSPSSSYTIWIPNSQMEKGWGDTNNIFEFICADIKTMKERVDHFDTPLAKYQETSESHAKCLSHLESFYGREEKDREDMRTEVIQTDQAVLPEANNELRCGYSALPIGPKRTNQGAVGLWVIS